MTAMWVLLGFIGGGCLVGLAAWARLNSRITSVTAERDDARERLQTSEGEGRAAREDAEAAGRKSTEAELALARAQGEHREQVATLTTQLEAVRTAGEEKLKLVEEAQDTMTAVLKNAAGEAFDGSGKKLVELTTAALKEASAGTRANFEEERKNVEQLVTPMKEGLNKLGVAVEKLDRDRERQHAEMGEQMRAVLTGQLQVRDEAAVLSRALTQPKAAGDWGEFHLKRLVESAGMSEFCDFDVQTRTEHDGQVLRPDLLIQMPGDKVVVVDSKTPLAPYREACAATDPAQRDRHMQMFARGVKAHVKKLSAKHYSGRFEAAMDFVVMYLPGDQFYNAAIEHERSLIDDAVKNRVLIATPVTFIGLLRTIAYSWQQDKVAETARDIARHGCTLYERLSVYLTHVDKVSQLVNRLAEAQNAAVGSLERSVLPEARRFPELGAVSADKELPKVRTVDRTARSVQAQEREPGVPAAPEGAPELPPGGEKSAISGDSSPDELSDGEKGMEAA